MANECRKRASDLKKVDISNWHPVFRLIAFLVVLAVLISPLFLTANQLVQLLLGTSIVLGLMVA